MTTHASAEALIFEHLPEEYHSIVQKRLYGKIPVPMQLTEEAIEAAREKDVEIAGYVLEAGAESRRAPRKVKIAAVQNHAVADTSLPIADQLRINTQKLVDLFEIAVKGGANIVGFQEASTAPFFFCLREKLPWTEFAETLSDGPTIQIFSELCAKHGVVCVLPLLERDDCHMDRIWNCAVVIDADGRVVGRSHKFHIPAVGDFNERTYYADGQLGWPVFQTRYGKIGVPICYERHFPEAWRAVGMNGAEIVFNPSATVDGLSEAIWPIEARCAAVANNYFTVAINRVGTEHYPTPFTSGDGKEQKFDFGHFYGSTYITGPDASRTPALSRTSDGVLITEVDLNQIRQVRDVWNFQMAHRYPDYAQLYTAYSEDDFVPQLIQ